MNHDHTLERLVKLRANGEILPSTVNVQGRMVETRRFLEGFRFDKREASPTMTARIATMERPLMCEVALSLL
ncbi:hypothetical protein ACVIGB_002035 [Bradyrhizobium sp. USDA 4341]